MSKILSTIILISLSLLLATTSLRAQQQDGQQDVMVVLDASGSMWGQIDGTPKIDIARGVMGKMLSDLGSKANIGVLTYGHREKGNCSDIETVIPIGKVNQKQYMSVINSLSPKGKTPITQAVQKAAEELRFTEKKATVVLISDGLETCQADPCALAKDLEKLGVDFTVHVVGFDLKNQDTASLQCLARETGGKYLAADNANELGDAIDTVVAQATEPEPEPQPAPADEPAFLKVDVLMAPGAKPLDAGYVYIIPEVGNRNTKKAAARGPSRKIHTVKTGKYYIEARLGRIVGSTTIEIKAGGKHRAEIVLNAGMIRVVAVAKEGGEPIKKAYIYIREPETASGKGKQVAAGNQRRTFTVPAGKYHALAIDGKARVGQMVEVVAGEKTNATIVLASGLLQVFVLEQEGGKPKNTGTYVYIYEAEKQIDGSRKQITAANPRNKFSLPTGKYYVRAQIGKAGIGKLVEITAGKLTETTIIVSVGALKVSLIPAEGGKPLAKTFVKIYELEKQLDGKRKQVIGGNQRNLFKLPAGKYHVVASIGKVKAAQEVIVTAGKRTETVINANAGALQITGSTKNYVTIYEAEKALDGTRAKIASYKPTQPLMLPVGKYILTSKKDKKVAEIPFEITAGKLTEVALKLE